MGKAIVQLLFLFFLIVWNTACKQKTNGPIVQAVYPSSNILPENLLRMYVQFSVPMKTVGNLERIKLFDEEGHEVQHVFFNNVYELWNTEQTQLTLILDPARVKTGLEANQELGRAIQPQHRYTLVIEGLEDVHHQKMEQRFEKKINVVKADLRAPDTKNWMLTMPKANSKTDFTIQFAEMLDYHSVQQRLIVTNSENKPVEGLISVEKQETLWRFQPVFPWEKGDYVLHINTRLEDPAGNNLNGLFDHKPGSLKYLREGVVEQIRFTVN